MTQIGRAFCGEFPNDDVDDCIFPEDAKVGDKIECERCSRPWELVGLELWKSVTIRNGDGNLRYE